MESVYKLSKYSQKISEACRAKQLDKVMEYNQHELAHINKLSKYFGNQKGGATVDQVVGAVGDLVKDVVADRNEVIRELQQSVQDYSKFMIDIDNEVEEKVFSISAIEAQTVLRPEDVLRKVKDLKEKRDELTVAIETLQGENKAVQGVGTVDRIRVTLETKVQELSSAQAELAKARTKTDDLQKSLTAVSSRASDFSTQNEQLITQIRQLEAQAQKYKDAATESAKSVESKNKELATVRAQFEAQTLALEEANTQVVSFRTQLGAVQDKVKQKTEEHSTQLLAKNDEIAKLQKAVEDTQRILEKSKARSDAILNPNP